MTQTESQPVLTNVAERGTRPRSSRFKRMLGSIAAVGALTALFSGLEMAHSEPAQAAAYTRGAYAPHDLGDQVEGWANIATDCEGTVGCWAYIKIEERVDGPNNPSPAWLNPWQYAGGQWASEGWNKVDVPKTPGCADYRVVVDTYNDFVVGSKVDVGADAGAGPVDVHATVENGVNVSRYHASSVSNAIKMCAMA